MIASIGSMGGVWWQKVRGVVMHWLAWFAAQSRIVRGACILLPLCAAWAILVVRSLSQHDRIAQPTDAVYRLLPPQSTQVVVIEPARYPALISWYRGDIGTWFDAILVASDRFILGQARDSRGMPFGYFAGRTVTGMIDQTMLPRDDEFVDFIFVQGYDGAWYRGPDPALFALPLDDNDLQEYRVWRMSMTDANLGIWFDFDRSIPVDPSAITPVISDVSFASVHASWSGDLDITLRLGRKNTVALPLVRLQADRARVIGGEETMLSLRVGGVSVGQRLLSVWLSQFIPDMPGLVSEQARAALLTMLAETLVDPLDLVVSQGTDFPVAIGLRTTTPALTMFLRTHYPTIQNILAMVYPDIPVLFMTGGFRADLGEGLLMQGWWRVDGEQSVLWLWWQPFGDDQPMLSSSLLVDQQIVWYLNGDALLPLRALLGFDDTLATFLEGKQWMFGLRFDERIMTVQVRLE